MKSTVCYLSMGIVSFGLVLLIHYGMINLNGLLPDFSKWGYTFFVIPAGYGWLASFTKDKSHYQMTGFLLLCAIFHFLSRSELRPDSVTLLQILMVVSSACFICLVETIRKNRKQASEVLFK